MRVCMNKLPSHYIIGMAEGWIHDLSISSPSSWPLHHQTTDWLNTMSMLMSIYIVRKCETSIALIALVWSKHERFHMLPKCNLSQQHDHAGSPATSSTPTDQPQRKPVGRWCLAGSKEWPGVVKRRIKVAAVMRRWRSDSRNLSGTVELGHVCSWTSWRSACRRLAWVHRASAAQCAGAATSHKTGSVYDNRLQKVLSTWVVKLNSSSLLLKSE